MRTGHVRTTGYMSPLNPGLGPLIGPLKSGCHFDASQQERLLEAQWLNLAAHINPLDRGRPPQFTMMSHNAKANDNALPNAPVLRSADHRPKCHKCGEPGHYAKTCKVTTKRGDQRAGAVAKSVRDAVDQADGLKIALADKEKELTDLKSEQAKAAKMEAIAAKDALDHLKARSAQHSMSPQLCLGSSPLTMWKRCLMLWAVLMLSLAHVTVISWIRSIRYLGAVVLFPIHLMTFRVRGYRTQPLLRKLCVLVGLCILCAVINTAKCLIMHHTMLTLFLGLFGQSCVTTILFMSCLTRVKGLWMRISTIRSCPTEVWNLRRLSLKIVGPTDCRDDTAATVDLKHTYDHVVTYDVVHPTFVFRVAWSVMQFGCCLAEWFVGHPVIIRVDDLIDAGLFRSLTYGCSLDVSSSLARQVKIARNTPLSMNLAEVRALVERAAANEGFSNINSFAPHDTQGEVRFNTARYVMAQHVLYREELERAGF